MNLVFGHLKLWLGKLEELSAFDLFQNARKIFPAFGATVDAMRDDDVWRVDGRKTMSGVSLLASGLSPALRPETSCQRFFVPVGRRGL